MLTLSHIKTIKIICPRKHEILNGSVIIHQNNFKLTYFKSCLIHVYNQTAYNNSDNINWEFHSIRGWFEQFKYHLAFSAFEFLWKISHPNQATGFVNTGNPLIPGIYIAASRLSGRLPSRKLVISSGASPSSPPPLAFPHLLPINIRNKLHVYQI